LPYTPGAWIKEDATKIGYEASLTRHFNKPQLLRSLAKIRADILALEHDAEGMLAEIIGVYSVLLQAAVNMLLLHLHVIDCPQHTAAGFPCYKQAMIDDLIHRCINGNMRIALFGLLVQDDAVS
jgi:hypothetical protein